MTGGPGPGWKADWLVVAGEGGGAFILSRTSGVILHDVHGRGFWAPRELFPDLNTMAACLGQLGVIVASAGENFSDEDCLIRPVWQTAAIESLQDFIGSPGAAREVLRALGWN